jgi:holo-[acyl-carrier protein] synthase
MMILGIGNDIIDIRRVERTMERFGDRFLDRVFTEIERARSDRRAGRAASYAKRFAAKEACSKALGTGLRAGVFWRDMGVINLSSGKPTMRLTGGALARLVAMTPKGLVAQIDLTITDDYPSPGDRHYFSGTRRLRASSKSGGRRAGRGPRFLDIAQLGWLDPARFATRNGILTCPRTSRNRVWRESRTGRSARSSIWPRPYSGPR